MHLDELGKPDLHFNLEPTLIYLHTSMVQSKSSLLLVLLLWI
jgi:hypothetical protein